MIESGWLEFRIVMTVVAGSLAISFDKLGAVDVRMALLAGFGRCLEVNVGKLGLKIRWFVTIDASYGAVRAEQRKVGLGVIETR